MSEFEGNENPKRIEKPKLGGAPPESVEGALLRVWWHVTQSNVKDLKQDLERYFVTREVVRLASLRTVMNKRDDQTDIAYGS